MAIVESSEHFSRDELACRHTDICLMEESFLQKLEAIREEYGKPMRITSAFRDETHPAQARKSNPKMGYHTKGRAVDVLIRGTDAVILLEIALKHGMRGIGINQKGGSGRFLHFDDRDEYMIWSY
jgi:uncharacterized protein YcbK (DUF882 family)